jgi:sialidase-1
MQLVQDEWEAPAAKVWIGNPSPVVDVFNRQHTGRIWLAFTRSNERMFVAYSDDHGQTWSERRDISKETMKPEWDWVAAGPVHGIQLFSSKYAPERLVIACDHQIKADGSWGAHLVYSDDHGKTWHRGATETRAATDALHPNECVAVELADGRIYVNARDQHGSDPATRAVAYSSDGGVTFDAPFAAEPGITTPVVQNSAIRFAAKDRGDARNILVHSCPGNAKDRRDLTILTSFDEGASWPQKMLIHEGPAAYSDLVKLNNDKIGVLYEAGARLYGEIVFAVVDFEKLSHEAAE